MTFDAGIFVDALFSRALREGIVMTIALTIVSALEPFPDARKPSLRGRAITDFRP